MWCTPKQTALHAHGWEIAYVTVTYRRRHSAYTIESTLEPHDRSITDGYSLDEALQQHWQIVPAALLSRMIGQTSMTPVILLGVSSS